MLREQGIYQRHHLLDFSETRNHGFFSWEFPMKSRTISVEPVMIAGSNPSLMQISACQPRKSKANDRVRRPSARKTDPIPQRSLALRSQGLVDAIGRELLPSG
jgi:hypothetical protein